MTWFIINGYYIAQCINYILDMFIKNRTETFSTNYKWCECLRNNYTTILEEYIDYTKNNKLQRLADFDKTQAEIDISDIPWEVLILRIYNKDTNKIKYFPKTYDLIKNIPGCISIIFSVLLPGKLIPLHKGPYKGVLRYHLGLISPKINKTCYIKFDEKFRIWQEGKDLLLDETYWHYIHNSTDEPSVILMLDIKRNFNNIFIDKLNNFILYISKFNITVTNIVNKTNSL